MKTNTVLDFKGIKSTKIEHVYDISTISALFSAIGEVLAHNPDQETIKVYLSENIDIQDIMFKHGFKICIKHGKDDKASYEILQFKGHTRWVYFLNDKPVFFDSSGSLCDTCDPPHMHMHRHKAYKTLKFDRVERITI